jgi:hypothetical protein
LLAILYLIANIPCHTAQKQRKLALFFVCPNQFSFTNLLSIKAILKVRQPKEMKLSLLMEIFSQTFPLRSQTETLTAKLSIV